MEFQSSLEQLETAARMLMAPPNVVSREERLAAENIIVEFRKVRNAFGLCKFIIENSRTELIVFEAANVLKSNLIQDWNKLQADDIQALNNTLLGMLVNPNPGSHLTYSALRRLAAVVALIVKHQSLGEGHKTRNELVHHLVNSVLGNSVSVVSACCVFDALMAEHQYVVNVTDASLTYEMHFAAKKDFENSDLLKILQFCLRWLSTYSHDQRDAGKVRDLACVLKLLESLLYWNFSKNLPRRVVGVVEMEATPAFKPPLSWIDTINDAGFVHVFFDIHKKLRNDVNLVSVTLNSIVQLVSMHGPLLQTRDQRIEYLSKLIPPISDLLKLPNKSPGEALGIGDIMRRFMLFNRSGTLLSLPSSIFNDFIESAGAFTCNVIQMSILEESKQNVDDRVYRESLTRILESWMTILTDTDAPGPKEVLKPVATNIFNAYLQAHISPPEGFRQSSEVLNEDVDEEDESDSNLFRDQLQAIGVFGRFVLNHSVPIINNLLAFKCAAYTSQIEAIAGGAGNREALDNVNEDLHWVILIAGHILAFDGFGETNLIPPEIIEASMRHTSNADASANAIQSAFMLTPVPDSNDIDPIVAMVCRIVYLAEMQRRVLDMNLGEILSPEVACNVLWFMYRWAQSYFNMNEEYYSSVSPSFIAAWGIHSPTSAVIQSALFRRIREDLVRFSGEADVMIEATNLLLSLVDTPKKAETAIQSPELPQLMKLISQVGPGKYQMPNEQYQKFVRAMVTVGSCCEDQTQRNHYWEEVISPLVQRFRVVLTVTQTMRHQDDVRQELAYVISGLIGTALSANSKTATALYEKIGPAVVSECGALLRLYRNYVDIVELILMLMTEVGRRCLSYLSHANSVTLYEGAMAVVNAYAEHNTGRKNYEKSAEEDSYNDLVLLLDMLSCLLTKDFLDLCPEAVNHGRVPPVSAAEVSLQGLGIVLPFMNAELLRYPNLSNKYFRLVAFVTELHAERVMQLPGPMVQGIFESVQHGLETTTTEGFTSCCEFVLAIANFISQHNQQNSVPGEICRNFLKYFLEVILSDKVNKEAIPAVSSALFALISAYTNSYHELARQLILSRPPGENQQKLSDAFEKLTANLNLGNGGDRQSRAAFRDRLENFIFVVRGCLD